MYKTKDFDRIRHITTHPDIVEGIFEGDEDVSALARATAESFSRFYVFESGDRDIGFVAFYPFLNYLVADVGFVKGFRGHLASRLAKQALDDLMQEFPGVVIVARIRNDNRASQMFARWLGFAPINKGDDWALYVCLKSFDSCLTKRQGYN